MLEKYYSEYKNDADFVAERLAIDIIENALCIMRGKDISRSDLARSMGIPKSQVSRIFNAPPNLTLRSVARLAIALDVKPQALLAPDSLPAAAQNATRPVADP